MNPTKKPRAVVLLSGGLDSATALAIARSEGYDCYALTIDYGQRHRPELNAAQRVARSVGVVEHLTMAVDLGRFGGSVLTGDSPVPVNRDPENMAGVPPTYVPARNTILLSLALAWSEALQASDIYIGINSIDYSGYPDCRPEFVAAFTTLANLATKAGSEGLISFTVRVPLIGMTKADIVRRAAELSLDLSLTWTCYDPQSSGRPCRICDACILRRKGFLEAGITDPTW